MKNRIKALRKELGMTQQAFADRIGIKRNSVAKYETGENSPSSASITLICREFRVNETWLRTGEGEMFLPKSQEEELAEFMADIMKEADETFRARFIKAVSRFNRDQWHALESVVMALYEQDLREKK